MNPKSAIFTGSQDDSIAADLETLYRDSNTLTGFASGYFLRIGELLSLVDLDAVERMVKSVMQARAEGKAIYVLGNGGSAALASHFTNDLGVGVHRPNIPSFRVHSLSDNPAIVTAIANDEGYENVFVRQLEGVLSTGDVVIAFSVSGNSPNVLNALLYAGRLGATTIGCCGFDGGRFRELVDIYIHIPTPLGEYGPVEDIFCILGHMIYSYLRLEAKHANVAERTPLNQGGTP